MPADPRTTTARARGYYERLGGAGISRVLYECLLCGAAVSARDVHDEWHRRQK